MIGTVQFVSSILVCIMRFFLIANEITIAASTVGTAIMQDRTIELYFHGLLDSEGESTK